MKLRAKQQKSGNQFFDIVIALDVKNCGFCVCILRMSAYMSISVRVLPKRSPFPRSDFDIGFVWRHISSLSFYSMLCCLFNLLTFSAKRDSVLGVSFIFFLCELAIKWQSIFLLFYPWPPRETGYIFRGEVNFI